MRLSASRIPGRRTDRNGHAAITAIAAQAITATARPSGGSHSQSPSQDSARNRPTAVASEVNAGHTRSQKIVQRARLSVASSSARVASGDRGGGGGGGPALGKVASVTRIPSFSGPAYRHHTYQQGNMRAGSRHQNPLAIMLCNFKARAAGGRAAAVSR